MGGTIALGYYVKHPKLIPNEAEAGTVRRISSNISRLGALKADIPTRSRLLAASA
jgi:hypothetical protein